MSEASDKLARTRLAIVDHVYNRHADDYAKRRDPAGSNSFEREGRAQGEAYNAFERARHRGAGWYGSFRRAASTWWRHHPAHLGVELATPVLSKYAARQPAVYLGVAAAAGALFVVTRPWRLISATGLIVALLKSSQLSSMVMSAMSAANVGADDGRYP